ncbi:hypothetical protein [Bacteroides ovatus]|jgi:hypothetical protein|uniref:hypothetical protein n=1 Tax=Bacteroides ovatus TaxID=28116 RepID=UPI00189837C5|nr:hypothetical protein [Bacteroides ovatus]MDC2623369.1 hypothetical protein [Bacteroides ovatus]MDC2637110.1 hypothetical protein [Bacteroides ovatus]MDC2652953.1 hypothetical protein [Bacteroides ovatus]DAP82466.1 MAG TPA: hypothetical protein [Caudoviricetes sp.]
MLIDVSFFTSGPRHIQNASVAEMPTQDSLAVNEAIEAYIKAFQPEYLHDVVGASLSRAIVDYLELIEQEKDKSSDEVDISEEKEEEASSGYAVLCEKLREPFADYVFYHILRDANTQATVKGLVRLKCANEYVAPIKRQVSTWNSMVKKNRLFVEWVMSDDCPFAVKIQKNLLTPINTFNL